MYTKPFISDAASRKGGALIYILIAIALLAALTGTFLKSDGQSTRTQNSFKLATELNSQSRVVRSAVQDCILRYSRGDDAINEAGYIDPYPLNPDSDDAQYASYKIANRYVEELRCPGAGYDKLFGGSLSGFLPTPPALMDKWSYFNGSETMHGVMFNGVFFQIQSDKSDPFIAESMEKIDGLYSGCEVDYVVGNGSNGCADGYQCLRFWIVRKSLCLLGG